MKYLHRYPATIFAALILIIAACFLLSLHQTAERCHKAGGVWLSYDRKCVRGQEIQP